MAGSVLLRRTVTRRPSAVCSMSFASRAISSERRNAPAKPSKSRARSRRSASRGPALGTMAMMSSAVAGVFLLGAIPTERRMPRKVARWAPKLPFRAPARKIAKSLPWALRVAVACVAGKPDLELRPRLAEPRRGQFARSENASPRKMAHPRQYGRQGRAKIAAGSA